MTELGVAIFGALGVTGAVLTASGWPWWGHLVWLVTDAGLVAHNLRIRQRAQAALFGAYGLLAVLGLWTWG